MSADWLTHWGRVTHICVSKLTTIGTDNGLSPGRRQAIIRTNAGLLLIGPWGTNFNENFIDINTFSLKKINLKMSSGKWRPFCLGLNVLSLNNNLICLVSCWYEMPVVVSLMDDILYSTLLMMTSSNGNIFHVTGYLCGEFPGPRWIPTQRPVTRSFDVYFDLRPNKWLNKQLVIWDAIVLIMTSS